MSKPDSALEPVRNMSFMVGSAAVVDGSQQVPPALLLPRAGCLSRPEQTAGFPTCRNSGEEKEDLHHAPIGTIKPETGNELMRTTSVCSTNTDFDMIYPSNSHEAACPEDMRHATGGIPALYCLAIPCCWVPHAPVQPLLHPCSDGSHLVHTACQGAPSGNKERCEDEVRTTLMLRNLSCDYERGMLLELLNGKGFSARYNFIYLPFDFHRRHNLGYAFVNMETTQDAMRAWECFNGFQQWQLPSTKVCEVSWAQPLQGLKAHIKRFQNSPVMHEEVLDEWKPMLFSQGHRIAFPGPTQWIRPPRMKYCKQQKVVQ